VDEVVFTITRLLGDAGALVAVAIVAALYLLPTIVGVVRRKDNWVLIAAVNVFLGWTIVAWAVMLLESFTDT